jgi:hypothetical protein
MGRAEMLCRGIVRELFTPQEPPLASLLRVAVDIIWLWVRSQNVAEAAKFAVLGKFPYNLLDPGQCESLYRPLVVQAALILAQAGHCKEAILTLKSVLGPDFEELRQVWEFSIAQDLNATTLPFERSVMELTGGRVQVFHNGTGWLFFDNAAEAELVPAKVWYRDEAGNLKREEMIVRGTAMRTMVEVQYQQRRDNMRPVPPE